MCQGRPRSPEASLDPLSSAQEEVGIPPPLRWGNRASEAGQAPTRGSPGLPEWGKGGPGRQRPARVRSTGLPSILGKSQAGEAVSRPSPGCAAQVSQAGQGSQRRQRTEVAPGRAPACRAPRRALGGWWHWPQSRPPCLQPAPPPRAPGSLLVPQTLWLPGLMSLSRPPSFWPCLATSSSPLGPRPGCFRLQGAFWFAGT